MAPENFSEESKEDLGYSTQIGKNSEQFVLLTTFSIKVAMEWENAWAGNPNLPNPSNDMSNKEYTDALLDVGQVLVGMGVGVAKQEQEGSGNSFGVEESLRNLSPIDIDTLDKDMAAQGVEMP